MDAAGAKFAVGVGVPASGGLGYSGLQPMPQWHAFGTGVLPHSVAPDMLGPSRVVVPFETEHRVYELPIRVNLRTQALDTRIPAVPPVGTLSKHASEETWELSAKGEFVLSAVLDVSGRSCVPGIMGGLGQALNEVVPDAAKGSASRLRDMIIDAWASRQRCA